MGVSSPQHATTTPTLTNPFSTSDSELSASSLLELQPDPFKRDLPTPRKSAADETTSQAGTGTSCQLHGTGSRPTFIDYLHERFPNGPPAVYDKFIRVSLSDVHHPGAEVVNPGLDGERHRVEDGKSRRKWPKIVSQMLHAFGGKIISDNALPLYDRSDNVLNISAPHPLEPSSRRVSRSRTPPVEQYATKYTGLGPPPQLCLSSRPASRASSPSHYPASGRATPPIAGSSARLPIDEHPFTPAPHKSNLRGTATLRNKVVRIITPHMTPANSFRVDISGTSSQSTSAYANALALSADDSGWMHGLLRVLRFSEPARSLFFLGFLCGPQTWLIGGWALLPDNSEPSLLRVWVDRFGDQQSHAAVPKPTPLTRANLLYRGQVSNSVLEEGRHAPPTSMLFAVDDPVIVSQPRLSRAVWADGPSGVVTRRGHIAASPSMTDRQLLQSDESERRKEQGSNRDTESEVSVVVSTVWVYRCRVAAVVSGISILAAFLTSLAFIILHW